MTKSWWMVAAVLLAGPAARADAVTDWNAKLDEIVVEAKLTPPAAWRLLAIVHTAMYESANAITRRYPRGAADLGAAAGASIEAAVAEASRATLSQLAPAQQSLIDGAFRAALSAIPEGEAKTTGLAVGKKAAAAVLAWRADDGAATKEAYRPHTAPGVYVPTVLPALPQWPQRTPWLMTSATQFRPAPPPALTSAVWARDYNEVKALGGKNSTQRTTQQTEIARFWEASLPPIYHGVVRSVATVSGREVTQNARLFMAVAQAIDDALVAVYDAKYQYKFWRPITAIRNGDIDGNDATERDPSWLPFIDTPMHPEYPCAHCIVSGAVGTVLQAEIGKGPAPILTTTSVTAKGASRSWTTIEDFLQEVANARVYDGVHYRNSTEVGTAMGRKIGALAAEKHLRAATN